MFSIVVPELASFFAKFVKVAALSSLVAASPLLAQDTTTAPAVGQEYVLGASDRISIRMVAWDSTALAFTRFSEIEGEYTIAANGQLLLPLIGPVDAAGQTPSVLAEMITVFLQQSIGLAEEPSTTVEVAEYRPIYILGDVQRPGAYEFQPGLRVDQAIALAGGLLRADSLGSGAIRTALRDEGTLREALIEQVQFAVRAARLTAETSGATEITIPEGLSHPDGPDALTETVARENALFQSRRESQKRALDSLNETEALLAREASALDDKLAGLNRQLELVATQVENTERLVEQGLARSPALIALQTSQIDLQSRQTDIETALFRAQQGATEVERDRIDLETRRQETGLAELQTVRSEMAQIETRIEMLKGLRDEGQIALVDLSEGLDQVVKFNISRGEETSEDVGRTFGLRPLDVLEVTTVAPDDAVDVVTD